MPYWGAAGEILAFFGCHTLVGANLGLSLGYELSVFGIWIIWIICSNLRPWHLPRIRLVQKVLFPPSAHLNFWNVLNFLPHAAKYWLCKLIYRVPQAKFLKIRHQNWINKCEKLKRLKIPHFEKGPKWPKMVTFRGVFQIPYPFQT